VFHVFLEIEFKPQLESPETLGIDWLFEYTESESESSDIKGNFINIILSFTMSCVYLKYKNPNF